MFIPPTPAYRQAGIPPPQEVVAIANKGGEVVRFPAYRPRSRAINRPRAGQAGKALRMRAF
jgi:hypothetical protein